MIKEVDYVYVHTVGTPYFTILNGLVTGEVRIRADKLTHAVADVGGWRAEHEPPADIRNAYNEFSKKVSQVYDDTKVSSVVAKNCAGVDGTHVLVPLEEALFLLGKYTHSIPKTALSSDNFLRMLTDENSDFDDNFALLATYAINRHYATDEDNGNG